MAVSRLVINRTN
uniref:Uncharacterized protein n=1 Tax=Anguilla anguilla TaxID=7936 RepID=A0A0E9USF7_ANGAN